MEVKDIWPQNTRKFTPFRKLGSGLFETPAVIALWNNYDNGTCLLPEGDVKKAQLLWYLSMGTGLPAGTSVKSKVSSANSPNCATIIDIRVINESYASDDLMSLYHYWVLISMLENGSHLVLPLSLTICPRHQTVTVARDQYSTR